MPNVALRKKGNSGKGERAVVTYTPFFLTQMFTRQRVGLRVESAKTPETTLAGKKETERSSTYSLFATVSILRLMWIN